MDLVGDPFFKPVATELILEASADKENKKKKKKKGFLVDLVVKNLPASAGDMGSIPDSGRSHIAGATKPVHHSIEPVVQSLGPQCQSPPATTAETRVP